MTERIQLTCDEESLVEYLGCMAHDLVTRVEITQHDDAEFEVVFPSRLTFELRLKGVYSDIPGELHYLSTLRGWTTKW